MSALERFLDAVGDAASGGSLGKLVLGKPTDPDATTKWTLRPVVLRGNDVVQLVESRPGADRTTHLDPDSVRPAVAEALGPRFESGHLSTPEGSLQVERRGEVWVGSRGRQTSAAKATGPDRERPRSLRLDPRWTTPLGLTEPGGRPARAGEAKLRQVHRFVEVLTHAGLQAPEGRPLRLVDVGCGRGALTFAAWQLLTEKLGPVDVVGLELRPALAAKGEALAREVGAEGLSFRPGTIADLPEGPIDVVVALHACDTATDEALAVAHERGARHVLVAPCCHKELRPQLKAPAALGPALRHGILLSREADLATDALRAAVLEAVGWKARVFEFVSTEHTDKNLMIAAERRDAARTEAADEARALAEFFGVRTQALAERLGFAL